jgi:hypothetical protein
MKIVRLVLGVLATMVILTITVESIEFLIVKTTSGKSMEYLSNNQSEYFTIRNQTWILVLKVIYTFGAAFLAGWLGSKTTKYLQKSFFITIVILQGAAFLYAMLFSEFKDTLPIYYWLLLLILVLSGVYIGNYLYNNKKIKQINNYEN